MRLSFILPFALLSSPSLAQVPSVVTDIPAVHSLAAQVMGDVGTPVILLDQGADPHHFQLKPSQARALSNADLVFWVGPELTPWLQRALDSIGTAGHAIELLETPGTVTLAFADTGHDAEAGHDLAQDDDHEDEHIHDGIDPHAWLAPGNARAWISAMEQALIEADPEHAATYAANAALARDTITAQEAEVRRLLAPVGDIPIVVFHKAYGYFADAFGVNIAGTITQGDAAAPGAAHLAEIRADLKADGAVCIFPEAQHDPAYVENIVDGTGVRIGAPLDPSGSALPYGPTLYGDLLTGLARSVADCVTAQP